ncbi:Acetoin catabolism regulatory protein [compost metagenome]
MLELPPLREREDKADLLDHLLREESKGRPPLLDEDARQRLLAHSWPGNVRQLRNVLRTLVALCEDGRIRLGDLPAEIRQAVPQTAQKPASAPLLNAERTALLEVLEGQRWHMSRVAEKLGISRNTLYRKLRRHGISRAGA